MKDISKNSISLAGEFAVLSQLALQGYDANLTLGNTKGVDILVSDPDGNKMLKLEVKTSFNSRPANSQLFGSCLEWMMTEKHEAIIDPKLFYCFVNIEKEANKFRFFIVESKSVADYVRVQHELWLKYHPKMNKTPMRRFRIGLEDGDYKIKTVLARDCENNWNFKI